MRSIIVVFFTLFPCFFLFSQEAETAFSEGEYLKFRVRYGIFNTSFATLQLKSTMYGGKPVFHALGKGQTTGLAKLFFKVDDTYESYFDKQTQNPHFFNRDVYEGGYTKKLHFFFNQASKEVLIKDLEKKNEKKISIDPSVKDVVTAFYYFRNLPKMRSLQKNEEITMDMIFDDDELFKFRLKFLGKEEIETEFGKVNTLIFRPLVQDGRVFKEQESLTLWVTDDANRIPVKVKASLRVGSLIGELMDFRGLKHPSKLVKK